MLHNCLVKNVRQIPSKRKDMFATPLVSFLAIWISGPIEIATNVDVSSTASAYTCPFSSPVWIGWAFSLIVDGGDLSVRNQKTSWHTHLNKSVDIGNDTILTSVEESPWQKRIPFKTDDRRLKDDFVEKVACCRVPNSYRAVLATGCEIFPCWRKREAIYSVCSTDRMKEYVGVRHCEATRATDPEWSALFFQLSLPLYWKIVRPE